MVQPTAADGGKSTRSTVEDWDATGTPALLRVECVMPTQASRRRKVPISKEIVLINTGRASAVRSPGGWRDRNARRATGYSPVSAVGSPDRAAVTDKE